MALGLALAGPWLGPWPGLGWPLARPLAGAGHFNSNQFQPNLVLVQTGFVSEWFDSIASSSILSFPEA